jgi:uncharacterized protein YbjT (DUF2867 family)
MRIVVIGGTGLIGTRVVRELQGLGHEAVAAARATGVDAYTAEGLADVLAGTEVVVDVSNSPYTRPDEASDYFRTSTLNLLTYGRDAGVRHHVVLSVVGTDRLARVAGGYFAAKEQQERLVRSGPLPFSLVHSTQFFEFIRHIADATTPGRTVRVGAARFQPIAADDIAHAVALAALVEPTGRIVEHAGPEAYRLDEVLSRAFALVGDPREIVVDPLADYFGVRLADDDLMPAGDAIIAPTRLADWLAASRG